MAKARKAAQMPKRHSLTIEAKLRMLNELKKEGVLHKNVARKYKIAQSTLSTIIRNADKLQKGSATGLGFRKRIRASDYADVEESLLKWLMKKRAQNATIDGPILQAKAKKLAKALNYKTFTASSGWLSRFKERHGLVSHRKPRIKREGPTLDFRRRVRTADKENAAKSQKDVSTQAGAGALGRGGGFTWGVLLCFMDRNCAQTQTNLPLTSRDASTSPRKVKLVDKGCCTTNL